MKNKKIVSVSILVMLVCSFFNNAVIAENISKTDIVVTSSYPSDNKETSFIKEYIDKMLTLTDTATNFKSGSGSGKMVEDENLTSFDSIGYINWGIHQAFGKDIFDDRPLLLSEFTDTKSFHSGDWDSIKTDAIIGDVIVSNDKSIYSVYVGKNSSEEPIFLTCVGNPFVNEESADAVRLVGLDELGEIDGYFMLPETISQFVLEDSLYGGDFDRKTAVRDFDDIVSNQRTGYDVVDPANLK